MIIAEGLISVSGGGFYVVDVITALLTDELALLEYSLEYFNTGGSS